MDSRAFLFLAVAIAVAGCTQFQPPTDGDDQGPQITPDDGLSLTLTPSDRTIDEGERLVVDGTLRNTGQSDASINTVRRYGSAAFSGCSLSPSPTPSDPIRLRGAITTVDRPGGQIQLGWTCDGPSAGLADGESDGFRFGAAVTYQYSTTARSSFAVDGEGVSGIGEGTSNTGAPVHATLSVPDPAPVRENEGTVSVPVSLSNVGDGEVAGPIVLDASLPAVTGHVVDCPDEAELVSGGRDILCTIRFSDPLPSGGTQIFVRLDLSYNYTERAETTIDIQG